MLLFNITTHYSLWFLPLCVLCGLFFSYLLYRFKAPTKDVSPKIINLLFVIRTLLISALLFFLLEPFIKRIVNEKEKPIIILAQDNSASLINTKDSAYYRKEYLEGFKTFTEKLKDKYEVFTYRFSNTTELNDTIDFKGKETDYSTLFRELENNYSNRNLGAIVFASDGLYNKGANPLYAKQNLKAPVYCIALGDTNTAKDIYIKKIEHNEVAYLGNKFPINIYVEAKKLMGKSATLTIKKGGQNLVKQIVSITSSSFHQSFSFLLDADKAGVQIYTVQISPINEETNKANNIQNFVMEIIDTKEKIALITSAPHPDVSAIRESMEGNQNYELETFLLENFSGSVKPYSLVILNQVVLNTAKGTKMLNDLNANATPWFLISSSGNDKIPGAAIQSLSPKTNDAETYISKEFSLFTLSEEFKKYTKDFPAVTTVFGNYNLSNSMSTLLYQKIGVVETENPLLSFGMNGEQKYGVFFGEGIWKWRLRDFADHQNHNLFNELIGKIVQYLSVKADKSFFRVKTKKIVNENEDVLFDAEVYNTSYELVSNPEVTLVLTNDKSQQFNYTFTKNNTSYQLNIGTLPPGEYTYKAITNNGTKALEQKGSITIKELFIEQTQLVADHQFMSQLAFKHNAKLFYPNQLNQLADELLNSPTIKTITYSHKDISELIDLKAIFFILLGLLSFEWFIRKYNGLY
jgi:hypothetical protein